LLKNSGNGFEREGSEAHRSVIGKNILRSEKPLFQQPVNIVFQK
jgi:hypothetical protein